MKRITRSTRSACRRSPHIADGTLRQSHTLLRQVIGSGLLLACLIAPLSVHATEALHATETATDRAALAADAALLRETGRRLFTGADPLPARLVGSDTDLPARVARCANCHRRSGAPAPQTQAAVSNLTGRPDTNALGVVLNAETLTTRQPRRGGPATVFDADHFCHALRTGIDPAYILLPRAMPRYDLNEAQCSALWAYLTGPEEPPR